MSEFFLTIVNMSISASWIVLAVLLLRLLLKKAPKWITVLLWGIVAVRLVCPFTIESVMSLIPSAETISPEIMMDATPEINSGIPILNNTINPVIGESFAPDPTTSANPLQILIPFLAIVWLVGIAGMLLYTAISYFKVKRKIGTAVLLRDNIFQSENVVSPFVLGIIKPKIYLPFNMNEQDMSHVIAHEQAHIRRKDHWWKPFGFLLLALYWFNPFMWIGYALLCRDIELACDEKVVKEFDNEQKADYSQALLTCSVNRRIIAACPLAFGEVGVKNRVKSVLNYKKPAFWIIAIAIVASVFVAVCFLTNPATNTLENIEFLNLEARRENTVSVFVSDGETFTPVGAVNQDLLNELCNIKISKNEISLNRGEDRDKSHTLVLRTAEDTEPTTNSYLEGLYIHFNSTFTSVWVNNSVKPTLSYRVINPQKAKQIYEDIANFTGTEKLTWTYRPMLSFTGHSFRSFLFDLEYTHIEATCTGGELWNLEAEGQAHDTNMRFEKGKTVYWTPAEEDEDPADKSEVTLTVYNGDTKMQQHTVIFECVSRDYSEGDVYEFYLKDTTEYALVYSEDGYLTFVERSLISNVGGVDGPSSVIIGADESQYSTVIDTANFDIDGDGKEEQCALSVGPTSGLFTFIFSVSENGNLEYFNIFNSPYTELKFEKNAEGRMLLVGKSGEKTCYMGMDISDGNIVLSSDEQEVSYWGEQGLNSPYAPKAASDLNNAIAKVLNEKYQSEKPDGLIHIENYYLLAHQTASGTPLKGNTGHMKIANVYLLLYHMKYSVNGGQLEEHEGDFVPTAITFSIDENGKYTLKEYWTPQSGSNYKKDVRNKFPSEAAENALNTEKYAEALVKDSWRLANEAINKTSSVMIDDSTAIHYPANIGLYEVTPEDEVQTKYDNGEFVIRKRHYQAIDKTWVCEGYTYKYRLEITGRMNNANKRTTFIVLSNTKDITFEQTWKASGLSSLSSDYFKLEDAVIVGSKSLS